MDNIYISEPALELHSRDAPSVGGIITAQSVLTQGEIPEEGRKSLSSKLIQSVEIRVPKRGLCLMNIEDTPHLGKYYQLNNGHIPVNIHCSGPICWRKTYFHVANQLILGAHLVTER